MNTYFLYINFHNLYYHKDDNGYNEEETVQLHLEYDIEPTYET